MVIPMRPLDLNNTTAGAANRVMVSESEVTLCVVKG
jgi:hypothetical protein